MQVVYKDQRQTAQQSRPFRPHPISPHPHWGWSASIPFFPLLIKVLHVCPYPPVPPHPRLHACFHVHCDAVRSLLGDE